MAGKTVRGQGAPLAVLLRKLLGFSFASNSFGIFLTLIGTFSVFLFLAEHFLRLQGERRYYRLRDHVMIEASRKGARIENDIMAIEHHISSMAIYTGFLSSLGGGKKIHREDFLSLAKRTAKIAPPSWEVLLFHGKELTFSYPEERDQAIRTWWESLSLKKKDSFQKISYTEHFFLDDPSPEGEENDRKKFVSAIPLVGQNGERWGFLLSTFLLRDFYDGSLLSPETTFTYAVRGKSSSDDSVKTFFGPADLFSQDPVLVPIALPTSQEAWYLAAAPKEGWGSRRYPTRGQRILNIVLAAFFSLLVSSLVGSYRKVRAYALLDPLTGLSNRRIMEDMAAQTIITSRRLKREIYCLYIDLDHFKPINDQYGHRAGDRTLVITAERLQKTTRRSDMIFRVGGDEFVLIITHVKGKDGVTILAERILETLTQPIEISSGVTVSVGGSIGISCFPQHGDSVAELVANADAAMYTVKRDNNGNGFAFFER